MSEEKNRVYAILLPNRRMNPHLLVEQRCCMCQTCGYPYFQGGDLCAECEVLVIQIEKEESDRAFQAFRDFISPQSRFVHVYGVGYVDPWTREGKQYLDP